MSLQIFKRLSSTNFTWSILEYVAPYVNICEFLRFIFKRLDQKIVESLPAFATIHNDISYFQQGSFTSEME